MAEGPEKMMKKAEKPRRDFLGNKNQKPGSQDDLSILRLLENVILTEARVKEMHVRGKDMLDVQFSQQQRTW